MSSEASGGRRIALLAPDRRLDVLLPGGETVQHRLEELGYRLDGGPWVLLDQHGRSLALGTRVDDLRDGALIAIVDPDAPDDVDLRAREAGERVRGLSRAVPLAVVVALAAVALAVIAVTAVVGPGSPGFVRLAVVAGSGAAAAAFALMLVASPSAAMRGAFGVLVAIALVHGAVWLVALLTGASAAQAAAVCLGAVPVALRGLPAALLHVPPGYHIDFARFMTNRWTVRGEVPPSPRRIDPTIVSELIGASSSRLITGTVALSALAAGSAPVAIRVLTGAGPFETAGGIALFTGVLLALLAIPRGLAHPVARWAPRAAAVVVAGTGVVALVAVLGPWAWTLSAAALLVAVAIALLLPTIAAGMRSLAASRVADVVETLGVVLALPAGLVAAGAIETVRGMVS